MEPFSSGSISNTDTLSWDHIRSFSLTAERSATQTPSFNAHPFFYFIAGGGFTSCSIYLVYFIPLCVRSSCILNGRCASLERRGVRDSSPRWMGMRGLDPFDRLGKGGRLYWIHPCNGLGLVTVGGVLDPSLNGQALAAFNDCSVSTCLYLAPSNDQWNSE